MGRPRILRFKIPTGYAGTLRTAAFMARLIRDGARDFRVRRTALDILKRRAVRAKDYLAEIKALFEWVQQNLRYTKDTYQVEVLHSARRLLELGAGDCDDFSILLGSMLEAIGHPTRLVLTGPNPRRPRAFSHVYVEAFCNGRWIALDATMPHPMGWAPPSWVKKVVTIHRKAEMMQQPSDSALYGFAAPPGIPPAVREFIRSLRGQAIPARDPRVKELWRLLKQRQALSTRPKLQALLRRIWQGLPARPRPNTTRQLINALRRIGILPPRRPPGTAPMTPSVMAPVAQTTINLNTAGMRRLRRVKLQRVAAAQPAGMRPVRAVRLRRVGR
jgi:hypothetical protein